MNHVDWGTGVECEGPWQEPDIEEVLHPAVEEGFAPIIEVEPVLSSVWDRVAPIVGVVPIVGVKPDSIGRGGAI